MLYPLSLYSAVCQLYLIKSEEKKKVRKVLKGEEGSWWN